MPGGAIHAHTAKAAVEEVPLRNCTLSRMEPEVMRGAKVPKPSHERGAPRRTHISVAASQALSLSSASAEMKVCGEPVSIRATVV